MLDLNKVLRFLVRDFAADSHRVREPEKDPAWGSWAAHQDAKAQAADSEEADHRLILRAMVGAARVDGLIDVRERGAVQARMDRFGFSDSEQRLLWSELDRPQPPAALAQEVTNPDLARRVYAAAVAAIVIDTPAEIDYLATLARHLPIDPAVVAEINEKAGFKPKA